MNLEFAIPTRLYKQLENNNLLPIIESISNPSNLISIDTIDINKFNNMQYVNRIDFEYTNGLPELSTKPNGLILCINANKNITLGDIAKIEEELKTKYKNILFIYGVNINNSLEDNNIKIEMLLFKNIDLKEYFGDKFYNGLVKTGFINDVIELTTKDNLINIDLDDFKYVSNSEIVASISQYIDDINEDYKLNIISDKKATDCIINIAGSMDLSLSEVEWLLKKIRDIYPNLNIIYGTSIDVNLGKRKKVQALLTYNY